ncbi:MAG: hypothetical protein QXW00_01780 [Candidatus Woesearchaeota archaeon]
MVELKTNADRLLELVREKKKIGIDQAAQLLNLDKDTTQALAELLEDSGLLSIKYELTRQVLVSNPETTSMSERLPQEKIRRRPNLPKDPVELAKLKMKSILTELENDEKIISRIKEEIERIFKEKNEINMMLNRLESEGRAVKSEISGLLRKAELIKIIPGNKNNKLDEINKQLVKLYKKRKAIEDEIRALKNLIKI